MPSFMSVSSILLPFPPPTPHPPPPTLKSAFSVPLGLSGAGVRFQVMEGVGDLVCDLADGSTIPAPFAPPEAMLGGQFPHLSTLVLITPFCLGSTEGTARLLRTQATQFM